MFNKIFDLIKKCLSTIDENWIYTNINDKEK